jgi:hypothetical protein
MVIHSMLSKEWENRSNPRWQQAKRDETPLKPLPTFVIRRDSVGTAKDELFPEHVENVGSDADYWSPDK